MPDSIDIDKLLEQEKDFRKFAAEIALEMILADKPTRQAFISMVYGFYNSGIDIKTVKSLVLNMNRFNDMSNGSDQRDKS